LIKVHNVGLLSEQLLLKRGVYIAFYEIGAQPKIKGIP
jgi:hypothetical protein